MATEIWHEFSADAPVTIIPVGNGRLEVTANGETLFDRKAEGGIYPEMRRMREIRKQIKERLEATVSA
jgi:predicted Rdx family selenoprotein